MRRSRVNLVVGWSLVAVLGCGDSDGPGSAETDTDGTSTTTEAPSTTTPATVTSGSTTDSASGTSSAETSTGPTPSDTSVGGESSSSTGDPAACPGTTVRPGEQIGLQLEFDGRTRNYNLFVPSSYDGSEATPLVFNFHGFGSNAAQQAFFSDLNVDAEERGVIAVYPNGVSNSWNGGACCGVATGREVDDVGFVRALLDEVATTLCIDRSRVYATGMSNGGFMSHRLACEAADIITAVGPVAGPLGLPPEDCDPVRPIPVIHFHGTADTVVPYPGNLTGFPPVEESLQGWADRNGCDPESSVTLEMDDASCQTWDGCDADATVTLCTLDGVGHCWPGQEFCLSGTSSLTVRANELMLDLFEQHALP
ncbi:MAG: extracellular catalytic domain type 1 short-chain-length polyhydroxyalkanoate depolymerase [Nannocystales bacterium]